MSKSRIFILSLFLVLVTVLGITRSYGQTIAAGSFHSIAINQSGEIVGWGSNSFGQIYAPYSEFEAVAVAAGGSHSMALLANGSIIQWGRIGGDTEGVPELNDVTAISAGKSHSLALISDGTVVCWGKDNRNQCLLPMGVKREQGNFKKIEAGGDLSLALTNDGKLYVWGDPESPALSRSTFDGVEDFAAGAHHVIALRDDGQLILWGKNIHYQCAPPAGLKNAILNGAKVKQIAAGVSHSIALLDNGKAYAWGDNTGGRCDSPPDEDIVAIAAGGYHSLYLSSTGELIGRGTQQARAGEVPDDIVVALPNSPQTLEGQAPPVLQIDTESIAFIDGNGNNAIDALESCYIQFDISNTGPGPGQLLRYKVTQSGALDGIELSEEQSISKVLANSTTQVKIPITANRNTRDGKIQLMIQVIEPRGFDPDPITIELTTSGFASPKIEIVDFTSSHVQWKPNIPLTFDVLVQNTGQGKATDTKIRLSLPKSVNCYSNNELVTIPRMEPGQSELIQYDLIVPRSFMHETVMAEISLSELYGEYGSEWNHIFPFQPQNRNEELVSFTANTDVKTIQITKASFETSNSYDVEFNQVPKDIVVETVAVMPIDGTDCQGEQISGQDLASFTEGSLLGLYNVVERRNLERVLDEQRLALSGILYEQSAVEAGCNVGAQGIIFTEYGCLTGQEVIQLKLVDCQTSELYWSATGVNATAKQTLDKVRQELEGQ